MNNVIQMLQQFNEFRRTFNGNPEEEVKKLVASGKISQQQLNDLQRQAYHIQQMFNGMK